MKLLAYYLRRAEHSSWAQFMLNLVLWWVIPFNRPHRFWITKIASDEARISLPYRRSNHNHLRGLHACAQATAAEFVTGVHLLFHLDPSKYRIIMKTFTLEYLYQGRMNAESISTISTSWLEEHVVTPLESEESVLVDIPSTVVDASGETICQATLCWQIKRWDAVKTR